MAFRRFKPKSQNASVQPLFRVANWRFRLGSYLEIEKNMSMVKRAVDAYQRGNLEAADIILGDKVKYPEGSLPAVWAPLFIARVEAPPEDREAGPLFRAAA